jgi:hypothetical protein
VIDLDETLVHSSFKPVPNADFIVPVEIDGQVHQVSSKEDSPTFLRDFALELTMRRHEQKAEKASHSHRTNISEMREKNKSSLIDEIPSLSL